MVEDEKRGDALPRVVARVEAVNEVRAQPAEQVEDVLAEGGVEEPFAAVAKRFEVRVAAKLAGSAAGVAGEAGGLVGVGALVVHWPARCCRRASPRLIVRTGAPRNAYSSSSAVGCR